MLVTFSVRRKFFDQAGSTRFLHQVFEIKFQDPYQTWVLGNGCNAGRYKTGI
ncbi:hypothetical protein M0657_011126 [Pyricularia oryzae]|uniref:Uncharacterized protein n=2 Tax=Pyricularia oryzae TaxID=318829 RepID=A0AA97NW20_PYRO3|nr:hypothetical protein OOU_Y34scaffold00601g11 [Pyricularia oryzae Y34]KAI7910386.1 hypothetical protein M9X92_011134 [Pyricularia oryzae]KAI7911055.1 hypothetical protein M0657_011126 [Pyricularia oryzae]